MLRAGSKLEYVQYLATALSHVISRGQDQVGLAVLDGGLRESIGPGGMASDVMHVQEVIENVTTRPTTTMAPGLRDLFERSHCRGVLLLMSDFLVEQVAESRGHGGAGPGGKVLDRLLHVRHVRGRAARADRLAQLRVQHGQPDLVLAAADHVT